MALINSFLNNLFDTIAGSALSFNSSKDFIPIDGNGGTLQITGQDAAWLGLKNPLMQKYAYEYCFPVASVADRLAEMDVVGKIGVFRKGGKGKGGLATGTYASNLNKLFTQPNPFQSWEQYRGQQVVYKRIFGFCPVLPVLAAGMGEYTQFINLPPWLFSVRLKMQKSIINDKADLIDKWLVTLPGGVVELNPEDVIILEDSFMQDFEKSGGVLPQSRLIGLDMAVSNICAAMEADNVLLKKRGPLGFISHDAAATKDAVAGYLPMSKRERNELQASLTRYGLSLAQYQYVISRTAAKWNPMSFDIKQLGTKETIIQCEKAVCHRYNYPYALYEQTETTYANGDNAAASVYQDNIIPNATKDLNKYAKFLKVEENNIELQIDFSHVGALQEDIKMNAESKKLKNEALQIEWENNLITLNMWRVEMGYDEQPDGNVYYKDVKKEEPKPLPDMKLPPGVTAPKDDEEEPKE